MELLFLSELFFDVNTMDFFEANTGDVLDFVGVRTNSGHIRAHSPARSTSFLRGVRCKTVSVATMPQITYSDSCPDALTASEKPKNGVFIFFIFYFWAQC